MTFSDSSKLFLAVAASSVIKLIGAATLRMRKLRDFEYVGNVTALNLYPVKSCGPIQLRSVFCTRSGFCHNEILDRHWAVVGSDGLFINIQKEPKMASIKPSIKDGMLCLDAPGMPTLKLHRDPRTPTSAVVKICRHRGNEVKGLDCGSEASQWISKYLNVPGLSVVVTNTSIVGRNVEDLKKPWLNVPTQDDKAAFSEVCVCHLTSESSLEDLNQRLAKPVSMDNFRPCLVIKGSKGFAEDSWIELKIGANVYMRILEPNPRCMVITVDPKGNRDPGYEPLKTLRTFRKSPLYGDSPLFGLNLAVDSEGLINIGDPVYALYKSTD